MFFALCLTTQQFSLRFTLYSPYNLVKLLRFLVFFMRSFYKAKFGHLFLVILAGLVSWPIYCIKYLKYVLFDQVLNEYERFLFSFITVFRANIFRGLGKQLFGSDCNKTFFNESIRLTRRSEVLIKVNFKIWIEPFFK